MFTAQLTNLQQVHRSHNHFLAQNERMLEEAAQLAGKHSVDHVQRYPKFTPRTGKLQRGQKYLVRRTKSGRLLFLRNDVPYANPIDKGARPHPIDAKQSGWDGDTARQGYLTFYWKKKGRWVSTPHVNHPGNRPYKFAYRAWRSAYRVEGQILTRRMTELASRF